MDGNTHAVHGILLAELAWHLAGRRDGKRAGHSRWWMWFLGAAGGWSPDMDALGGVVENVFLQSRPWSIDLFYLYHRDFSHSLVFLVVTLACFFGSWLAFRRGEPGPPDGPRGTILGLPREWARAAGFTAVIAGFLFYGEATRFVATFAILAAMGFLAWSFIDAKQPLHGIVFFGAALLHHLMDAIQCEWNPLAPWNPGVEIGFFLYCGGRVETPANATFYVIFEIMPHVFLLVVVIRHAVRWYSRDAVIDHHAGKNRDETSPR